MPGRRRAATGRASGHPAARLRWGPCAPSLSGPRGLARPADAHRSPVVADPLPRRPAAETRGHRARPSGKRRSFPPLAAPVRAGPSRGPRSTCEPDRPPESRETHGAARGAAVGRLVRGKRPLGRLGRAPTAAARGHTARPGSGRRGRAAPSRVLRSPQPRALPTEKRVCGPVRGLVFRRDLDTPRAGSRVPCPGGGSCSRNWFLSFVLSAFT